MAGEKYKPRKILTHGSIKELVAPQQMGDAGKVDFEQDAGTAAAGFWTRRLVADPPGGFIFECHCGHKRRVTGEETNFFCERSGWNEGKTECDIEWRRLRRPTGEWGEDGGEIYEDITETVTVESRDQFTGKPRKTKIEVPVFEGRKVGEVKREEFARRRAAGQPESSQPTNIINQVQYERKNDGETPGDRVKAPKK